MTSWPPARSTRQPMSQKFVCATCLISGRSLPVSRTNGDSAYAACSAAATAGVVHAGPQARVDRFEDAAIERHQVRHERDRHARAPARFRPRADGRTRRRRRGCRGISEKCVRSVGVLPAPETPDFASMMIAGLEQRRPRPAAAAPASRPSDSSRRTRQLCVAQLGPVPLGQAVGQRQIDGRRRVRIPALPQRRVAQPERAGEIEDPRAALRERRRDFGRQRTPAPPGTRRRCRRARRSRSKRLDRRVPDIRAAAGSRRGSDALGPHRHCQLDVRDAGRAGAAARPRHTRSPPRRRP